MFLHRMGLVQCFVIVLMLSAQLVFLSPLTVGTEYYTMHGRMCKMCPAGEYQKSCTECEPCPAGTYTTEWNREDSCHRCYGDCRPDFHVKVVQNCTSKSDVKCICKDGFRCTDWVPYSTNCRYCAKTQETTTTAVISGKDKHTPSSASPGQSSTSAKPCLFPKCPQSVPPAENGTHKTDKMSSQLAAVLCPVVAMGCVALVILFFVRRHGDESCFKQAIAKLCNEGGRDASHKPKESTHQFPRDSFSAKQQPSSLSAANLGPVHVHNPGTVIFSLLSQFTGQVGPTLEGGKTAKRESSEDEDERDCPVFHPTSSPSVHLSEEERSGEIDSIFFPSQEQGKDCHVSKEEVLKS
ncbi:tumor necrosis factor receptor superfamily member 5 isoform X2 [Siniperca chuatsi]|uniref:tumor necrosis factor receptor superfamily member 5 isoform X2 n=1 Tax=Siniperca chuatsi TaxID=119488 RepID=UPI001CE1DF7F|nr:tumor necrosis factor receptor superfamily member 5 isoform X2 [Siniperca chuatsi]